MVDLLEGSYYDFFMFWVIVSVNSRKSAEPFFSIHNNQILKVALVFCASDSRDYYIIPKSRVSADGS